MCQISMHRVLPRYVQKSSITSDQHLARRRYQQARHAERPAVPCLSVNAVTLLLCQREILCAWQQASDTRLQRVAPAVAVCNHQQLVFIITVNF
jgi:hypothetical protein